MSALLWKWAGAAAIVAALCFASFLWGRSLGYAELAEQRAVWQAQHDAQVAETTRIEGNWKAKAEETERDLQTKLAAATTAADDLAVSLRHYRARKCPMPAATDSAAQPDGAGGEPADGDPVEAALGDHIAACARDAERLTAFQEFYRGLRQASP